MVDGLGYLTEDQRALEMKDCLEMLMTAHNNYNNFHNEEPHARMIQTYVPPTGLIPKSVRSDYVKDLIICKLGNSYGVAYSAEPYYDRMISMFQDSEIFEFLRLLNDQEVITKFNIPSRAIKFKKIAEQLKNNTKNEILKKSLDVIIDDSIKNLLIKRTYLTVKDIFK